MRSTDPESLDLPLLQSSNQNNHGIIGDGSYNFVNSGSITIEMNDPEDELDRLLGRQVSKDALRNSFYSPTECYPNTRSIVRAEIGEWIDESKSDKSPLLWLNGPAAVGKSAIAKTISGSFEQIAATYFFSTSSDRTAATLIPTLSWQVALSIPSAREHIIASLKKSGSLQTSQIEEQFHRLIIQPLKGLKLSARPVMVIDGIDECTDEDMVIRFLRALVQASKSEDMPVRFIICSRPEPRIRAILEEVHDSNPATKIQKHKSTRLVTIILTIAVIVGILFIIVFAFVAAAAILGTDSRPAAKILLLPLIILVALMILPISLGLIASCISHRSGHQTRSFFRAAWRMYKPIRLGVVSATTSSGDLDDTLDKLSSHTVISTIRIGVSKESKEDITRFLTDRFKTIHPPGEEASSWFNESDISRLVDASCGQFMYASIIVKLLDDPRYDPRDIFDKARRGSLPTPDMDNLYKSVIKRAQDAIPKDHHRRRELRFLTDTLAVLVFFAGNTYFFTVQKSLPVIEALLGLKTGKLVLKLSNMHSVLRIVPGESIHVHHRSFMEFLQNKDRSGEYHIGYGKALRRILGLMTRAGFRYHTTQFRRKKELQCVQDMANECHRSFFGRSNFPFILKVLHLSVRFCSMFSLYMWIFLPFTRFKTRFLLVLISLGIFFSTFIGTYIFSLIFYSLCFNHGLIVPFFHPFLHPLFHFSGTFLFPGRIFLFLLVIVPIVFAIIPAMGIEAFKPNV